MMADGYLVGDGSWNLRVHVTDLQVERTLRVKGDLHIGGVMLKLVEDLDIAIDWSDHALWWPARNTWLCRTRSTLDQYGVQADALLHFTPMHKTLRVQLPDLRYLDCRVNYSIDTISAVINICKELGIRHPEEMSLCKPLEPNHLKYNYKDMPKKRGMENGTPVRGAMSPDTNTFIPATSNNGHRNDGDDVGGSSNSLDRSPTSPFLCAPVSGSHQRPPSLESGHPTSPNHSHHNMSGPVTSTPGGTWKRNAHGGDANGSLTSPLYGSAISPPSLILDGTPNGGSFFDSSASSLAYSPATPSPEARARLLRPKTLVERARLNVAWLDSSLSIMEQGVREFDTLCLRFKFFCFYDLNPKYDAVRINQIYEQAKWQLLNEEIDCTEEEMLMFAALQVQVTLQSGVPQPIPLDDTASSGIGVDEEDDIEAALTDLQITLEGSNISSSSMGEAGDITQVPELYDYLRFLKPKRFTLRAFKRFWFTCRDLHLNLYKTKEDAMKGASAMHTVNLRGCEVTPEVNLASRKFGIKLEVPSSEGMSEMWIRCDSEEQYAKWMAACRLGAKGRSLADSSYEAEVKSIMAFLQMQRPAPTPTISPSSLDINPEDYIAPRFLRKLKGKLVQRILEAHGNVKSLSLTEAKMNFIRAWQSLPDYGVSLFVVKFMGHRKEELVGVAFNRLMRMDIATGDHLKTWRFNTMKAWNVNWEVKHMMVQFEEGNIIFSCHSADCKVIHEFIGGYIFLSMRSKEANQSLNLEMFHKLTGGWA